MSGFTLARFNALTDRYPADFKAAVFLELPAYFDNPWAEVATRARQEIDEYLHDPILDREPPAPRPRRAARTRPSAFTAGGDDPLLQIPPAEYVERLVDVEVPPSGVIRCPLPGHDDRTPSFKVYPDPGRGVWCHGCQRGGSIIDFRSALDGGPTGSALRGEAFKRVRAELLERFCHARAAA